MHGYVERGARDELLVVKISGVNPRRAAADAASRRRVTHAAEEGMQRNFDSVGEVRDHAIGVERNDLRSRIRKFVGENAASRPEAVVGVRNGELDFEDA